MIVQNMDIAGLVKRIRRFKYEVHKCVSAGLMHTTEADLGRFRSYTDDVTNYFDWMVSRPQMDLPEWHPTDLDLGEAEVLTEPENEALNDLLRQLDGLEAEVAYSQSARMHTSIMAHDEQRFRDILEKVESYFDYIETVQPLDQPESTPLRELTGKGRRTVKKA